MATGGWEIRRPEIRGLSTGTPPEPKHWPQSTPSTPRDPKGQRKPKYPQRPHWAATRPRFPAACGWPAEAVRAERGVSGHRQASRHAPEPPNLLVNFGLEGQAAPGERRTEDRLAVKLGHRSRRAGVCVCVCVCHAGCFALALGLDGPSGFLCVLQSWIMG